MVTSSNREGTPAPSHVFVCGAAWCLMEDYRAARRLYPDAHVIAVNEGARHVRANHLFTLHPRKFQKWITAQKEAFGDEFETHSAGTRQTKTKFGQDVASRLVFVDSWWPEAATPGGSGWGGRRLAKLLGYDFAVLCGIPLAKGKYQKGSKGMPRDWQRESSINHYREGVLADTAYHEGVISMSGWTREVLGGPCGY